MRTLGKQVIIKSNKKSTIIKFSFKIKNIYIKDYFR